MDHQDLVLCSPSLKHTDHQKKCDCHIAFCSDYQGHECREEQTVTPGTLAAEQGWGTGQCTGPSNTVGLIEL